MKNYGMPMEFDTMEVWNKLSGGKPLSDYPIDEPTTVYECDTVYSDIPTLAQFQKAMDRVMREKRGK